MAYDPNPRYATVGGTVTVGWDEPVHLLGPGPAILAVDGPEILDWQAVVAGITGAAAAHGRPVRLVDMWDHYRPWDRILALTESDQLLGDSHFARLPDCTLADLLSPLPPIDPPLSGLVVVFGPGAALARHDVLWYADLPKRYAEQAVGEGGGRNLGQPAGHGEATSRRLLYIDWPLLDRHRDSLAGRIDRFVDTQVADHVTSIDGIALRATLGELAPRPIRLRPTFNSQPWGGHWAQRELRMSLEAPNSALGYELIAQEGGILVGDESSRQVELPFQLLVSRHPTEVLSGRLHDLFGTSFPIRFDYLDTLDGGNLSVHCHPRPGYMTDVFGFPYPQHETYYLMVGSEGSRIFLGLRDGADIEAFHADAHDADSRGRPFDIERYVQTHPADPHQLFSIPSGTPHGSGEGNVVLEVSATPYLYSLRFYDWLRLDGAGKLRPIHVEHAFANLGLTRTGASIREQLIRPAQALTAGVGWHEELLSRIAEVFFEVRRVVLDTDARVPFGVTDGFHVLNVVDGPGVIVSTDLTEVELSYGETLIVPAAVDQYDLRRLGSQPVRVVKALVR